MTETAPRVAIVGAGPAGFYAAEALLKGSDAIRIDLINRMPAPFGLVRDGVAPDHQAIKSVARVYERILARARVRYFGNVALGRDLEIAELRSRYDQIVHAVGAQSDRRLGIPGEDLRGSHGAFDFVGWYNGHPDFRDRSFDLDCEEVVVVGNGNVAIDVARILVHSPERLAGTDIADHALAALRRSRVRRVTLLGRRGPAQASFTNPELREFGRLEGVVAVAKARELELDPASASALAENPVKKRNVATLRQYAANGECGHGEDESGSRRRARRSGDDRPGRASAGGAACPPVSGERVVRFRFLVSPLELLGEGGRVAGVRVERNRLVRQPDGYMRAVGTGEKQVIPCGMVIRSVGYRGAPLAGVPFDERRGIVPNEGGRVVRSDGSGAVAPGEVVAGEYVVGWAKRGPSGVIGTNKADAAATVALMREDLEAGVRAGGGGGRAASDSALAGERDRADPEGGEEMPADGRGRAASARAGDRGAARGDLADLLRDRAVRWVDAEGWRRIDAHERARGEAEGRPRVKLTTVAEMLQVAGV